MSHKLPYGELHWSDDIYDTDDILNYKDGDDGYILEVDLEYPETSHDLHSDYPLAPENMSVSADMVCDFSKAIYGEYHNGKQVTGEKGKKLILKVICKSDKSESRNTLLRPCVIRATSVPANGNCINNSMERKLSDVTLGATCSCGALPANRRAVHPRA